ncbi:hypothetical protein LI142_23220 [Eubacterium limosum]|uniref:hypothetical protein n=1 Tax=Eubacterium limosum TaxID=1736 RepID=UPI001D060AD6|nr:hypothetical protein [Eubacterium limosum]MCB6572404.1 hypothetical protein [Eubacterium limosum]
MNDYVLVGIRQVEYESKKTGKTVKGANAYFMKKQKDVVGFATLDKWLSQKFLDELDFNITDLVDKAVQLFFDERGNLVSIQASQNAVI